MQVYFALLGAGLLGGGVLLALRRLRIAWAGVTADGHVLGPLVNNIDGHSYTATRVGYRLPSGEEVQFIHYPGTVGSLPPGTRVVVRYLPGVQGQQLVPSLAGYCLAPAVVFALAGVCLWLAAR